jgi:WD40 repeat protein
VLRSEPGFERLSDQVKTIAGALEWKAAIPMVAAQMPLIQDLQSVEWWADVLVESGAGDAESIARARTESNGLGLFVRSLVGLDREAAKPAFAGFLADKKLSGNQFEFVNLIINHLTERGVITASSLYESPFTDVASWSGWALHGKPSHWPAVCDRARTRHSRCVRRRLRFYTLAMRLILIGILAAVALSAAPAQQAPPATEVYLATLDPSAGVTSWMNISASPGYDNQPSFLPDSSAILFSSNRDGKQMDIYRYDIAGHTLKQLTNTADNEFSPTVTPDGKSFTVIRQAAADGTQLLVKYDLATGAHQSVVFENVKPVGYHAWIDATHVAMFILGSGQGQPATLQIGDTKTGTAEIAATGIGRSVLIRPRTGTVSFVTSAQPRMIKEFNPETKTTTDLIAPFENSQDAAWTPGGVLLMAADKTIAMWRSGRTEWIPLAIISGDSPSVSDGAQPIVRSVTRMAVSADSKWMAFVAEPAR